MKNQKQIEEKIRELRAGGPFSLSSAKFLDGYIDGLMWVLGFDDPIERPVIFPPDGPKYKKPEGAA